MNTSKQGQKRLPRVYRRIRRFELWRELAEATDRAPVAVEEAGR